MQRRYGYLFPDKFSAISLNSELAERSIPGLSIQAVSESGSEQDNSNRTHAHNDRDRDYFLDWWLWRANVFSPRIPNLHWRDFNQSVQHGEILLMWSLAGCTEPAGPRPAIWREAD